MANTDPRIDAYIERAAPFAAPILNLLRDAVHEACPGVEETIKWSMPFFVLDGRILAHMAAFKQHCAFGFWRGRDAADQGKSGEAMGQFGRIASPTDLPSRRDLMKTIRQAATAAANAPATRAAPRRTVKPPPVVPAALAEALAGDRKAQANFDAMPPSHRREYVEWIVEAKRDETRTRRVAQALAMLAEGKSRNWKYESC
ncbi:MAG: YdeI/OmpD-associated family protein [Caldimonas sp.]